MNNKFIRISQKQLDDEHTIRHMMQAIRELGQFLNKVLWKSYYNELIWHVKLQELEKSLLKIIEQKTTIDFQTIFIIKKIKNEFTAIANGVLDDAINKYNNEEINKDELKYLKNIINLFNKFVEKLIPPQ